MIPLIDVADGYTMPRIVVGGWQLASGHSPNQPDRDSLFSFWDGLLDRGFNTFDCADIYSGVEEAIGAFVRSRRDRGLALPQVHTKFVPDLADLPTMDRGYVDRIVGRSLARLGTERLDLVQFHWWDYSVDRYREVLGWLDDLRRDGRIRHLGLTNFDAVRMNELLATGIPIRSIQVQHSVIDRRPERGLDRILIANGIAQFCYGGLAGGFLHERWLGTAPPATDRTRSATKYRLVIEDAGGWSWFQEVLTALDRVARRHGVDVPAVALRWLLDRPGVSAAIVGATRADQVAALTAAFGVHLTDEDRSAIDAVTGPSPGPAGEVYEAERRAGSSHAAIMRYDLNARAGY
ncbi:MAG: aldo/keto reductase [Gemmatimonadales bacterium]